jgi:putative flippase GtrA
MSGRAASSPHHLPRMGLRYLLVGAVATAAHWALMVVLVEGLSAAAWWASGAGAVLGAQVAFVANRQFTFAHRGLAWPAWWRFMGTAVLGAVVGMLIVAVGVWLGWHYLWAQALATSVAVVLTFVVNRTWTFAGPQLDTP